MAKPQAIRSGDAGDLEMLVDTLCDSFAQDPMLNWVIPQTHRYPDYFRLLLREVYMPHGMIHVGADSQAVALWLPPEQRFHMMPRLSLAKLVVRLMADDGLRVVWRLRSQGRAFSRHMPSEPHYYLQFIGCRTSEQGQGIGSGLLAHGTRVCDGRGMPAYLESSNHRNVPLYERHGFRVIGEETIGRDGPRAWFMWREAR